MELVKKLVLLHEACRERELLQERPADACVTVVVAATLLGAEHDLHAVLAVGVFVTAVGVLARGARSLSKKL